MIDLTPRAAQPVGGESDRPGPVPASAGQGNRPEKLEAFRMRAVVQRVSRAEVRVKEEVAGRIDAGLLILTGIAANDTPEAAKALAAKVINLRILDDGSGRMNCSILERGGGVLCVSQFTLYGDARRGRRPSYIEAASPAQAEPPF